ncbi:response regulator transcription factor [Herpetosiphon llansteffanensis]
MSGRILIVDDDPAILSGVSTLLEQAGYEIAQAASVAQARAQLQAFNPPNLVILDLMLPDGDGFELCRQIRQSSQYLPILMLSARDELHDRVEGLTVGADDYLTKPFAPAELLARVRAILRLAQHQRETLGALECGKLRFDCELQRAWWDEQLLELTPKESGVLLQLMRQPSHVWGRLALLQTVWGTTFLGDSRIVDVCVQRLRAKINQLDPSADPIQTVRGFGYRLKCEP